MECQHLLLRPISNMFKLYKGSKRNFVCNVIRPLIFNLNQCPKILKLQILQNSLRVCSETICVPKNFESLTAFEEDIDSVKNYDNKIFTYMLKTAITTGITIFKH